MDCAQIWLHAPPHLPSKSGHCFSSMEARNGSCFRRAKAEGFSCENEFWKCRWLDSPNERRFLSPPLYFKRDSRLLLQCLEEISRTMLFPSPAPTSWYWIWNMVARKLVEHKLCLDVLPPSLVTLGSSRPSKLFGNKPDETVSRSILNAFAIEQVLCFG